MLGVVDIICKVDEISKKTQGCLANKRLRVASNKFCAGLQGVYIIYIYIGVCCVGSCYILARSRGFVTGKWTGRGISEMNILGLQACWRNSVPSQATKTSMNPVSFLRVPFWVGF